MAWNSTAGGPRDVMPPDGGPSSGEREPQYVWTNVELEWEEHHYIEARYWAHARRLRVTVNGDPLFDEVLQS